MATSVFAHAKRGVRAKAFDAEGNEIDVRMVLISHIAPFAATTEQEERKKRKTRGRTREGQGKIIERAEEKARQKSASFRLCVSVSLKRE